MAVLMIRTCAMAAKPLASEPLGSRCAKSQSEDLESKTPPSQWPWLADRWRQQCHGVKAQAGQGFGRLYEYFTRRRDDRSADCQRRPGPGASAPPLPY
jgi:hypothetical protein